MIRTFRTEHRKPLAGAMAGAAGGLLGAWLMNQFQVLWSKAAENVSKNNAQQQSGSNGSEQDEDTTMKAANKLARVTLGRELSKEEKQKAGPLVHYAFGAVSGAVYGIISEYAPAARMGFGTLFGAALFLVADEIAAPAMGLSEPPAEVPAATHAYALASHFVYGIGTEAARRGIRRAA